MSSKHDVVLVAVPSDSDAAVSNLADAFGIDQARARTLIENLPSCVKRGVSREVAATYHEAFIAMGALCEIRPSSPEPLTPDRRRISSMPPPGKAVRTVALAGTAELRTFSTPRAWIGYAILVAIVAVGGLVYWTCRAPRMGGLVVHEVGASGGGQPTVILLHGFGAPGDDLVPLAEELAANHPGVRFVIPEGRIDFGRGRAWWRADPKEAKGSREAVSQVVDAVIEDGTPADMIVIGGFSQGAILAMDVALNYGETLGGVAFLSGRNEQLLQWSGLLPGRQDLDVFVSHGRSDPLIGFQQTERFVKQLESQQYQVTFMPFDGGHSIPPRVRSGLSSFLSTQL